ncbi:MAG: BrnT family toxin [Pseudomonadota bacterium]|jgi:uncharacterized protein|nr:BrnT family toxin [Pseudomonadota bacterium]
MQYEWDENKRLANLRKHGLDFRDAPRVLEGPILSAEDSRFAEVRYFCIGLLKDFVVVVAYTYRGDVTRIISMRKATTHERKKFLERFSH